MVGTKQALVCGLMPEFDRDSGSRRTLDLIDFLRELGWAVTFVSQHSKCERRYIEGLQQRGVAVYTGAEAHVQPLIESTRFDLALFGLWHIAEPFIDLIRRASPKTRIIVDSVDLHFLRNARRLFTESGAEAQLDDAYGSEFVREINTYQTADAVLTVSRKEADLVGEILSRRKAFVVPDCESLELSDVPLRDRRGILFVGCFRHTPNADAIEYLCRDILPLVDDRIRAAHPVQIVGDGLSDDVRRHADGMSDVRLIGWVPSVIPYFERARLTILPLRYGAGTKRKLLQALMVGTPAVSTSIGAEGFGLTSGDEVLIADEPFTFAAGISRLAEDDRVWRRLARRGRAHMRQRHGREACRNALKEVLDAVMASERRVTPPRLESKHGHGDYADMVNRVRSLIARVVPPGATVAVASKGDDALVSLEGFTGWHFPQAPSGEYAGWYPADSDDAIAQVRTLVERGAQYLVVPATATWWLQHYPGLRRYLDEHGREVALEAGTCSIHAFNEARSGPAPLATREVRSADGAPEQAPGSASADTTRLIAFVLPQFHPIPENDLWWGKGFTEWTNVMRARPLFPGHYQPHVPADLGFYDLRVAETREAQAAMAREHGVSGFCYYHYWFEGKMLLERPFDEVLRSGRPDFPFCLCWANEPWSRRWDGRTHEVLQHQTYRLDDDRRHIEWLIPALADSRAITVDGKPMFLVYQAKDLPHPARTTEIWRSAVERAGLPGIYLIAVETGWDSGWDATTVGFDAKVLFQPQFSQLRTVPRSKAGPPGGLHVYDYDEAWPVLANPEPVRYRRYSSVFPTWDNSARKGAAGVAIHNATPASYEAWLRHAIAEARRNPPEHQLVFINAWNEWGEGCHLEPDARHGRRFLEATMRARHATLSASERPTDGTTITFRTGAGRQKRLPARFGRSSQKRPNSDSALVDALIVRKTKGVTTDVRSS